jgi:hypothetical protein
VLSADDRQSENVSVSGTDYGRERLGLESVVR